MLFLLILVSASQQQLIDYKFSHKNAYYSFSGFFFVSFDPDSVLDLIWDFKNIAEYSVGAKSIDLLGGGEKWYNLTYTYQKLIFLENRSSWQRTLDGDERKIAFELLSNSTNLPFTPEMEYSVGYYQVKPAIDGCMVEYFQECRITSGILENNYIRMAEKEAINFITELEAFIKRSCHLLDQNRNLHP
ncbi:MAG: SRPBCC family protein [Candidatus Marinimicrobia bacterium]|nr:SRPBCC family protein [Candidatus Neomarinimicrobiota bacterium]